MGCLPPPPQPPLFLCAGEDLSALVGYTGRQHADAVGPGVH
jgi:hypothetical protein